MITGTRVKVTEGVHHGKAGTVSSVRLVGAGDSTRALPTVRLSDDTEVEIPGNHLTVVR